MPSCIRLEAKDGHLIAAPGEHAKGFHALDEELACHFGDTPDPKLWYYEWYNVIGLKLALGQTLEEAVTSLQKTLKDMRYRPKPATLNALAFQQRLVQIAEYLNANYTTDAWKEFK